MLTTPTLNAVYINLSTLSRFVKSSQLSPNSATIDEAEI